MPIKRHFSCGESAKCTKYHKAFAEESSMGAEEVLLQVDGILFASRQQQRIAPTASLVVLFWFNTTAQSSSPQGGDARRVLHLAIRSFMLSPAH